MCASSVVRCKKCGSENDPRDARRDSGSVCGQCGATLTIFAEETLAPAECVEEDPDSGLADLRIPGYEIRREIGRGGMGYVFEARQESLDRSVAIKVLAPKLSNDPEFAARFEAEAAVLARLAHPNIVSIYERGRCGDRLYFVMEYVAGDAQGEPVDLKSIIAKGPLGNESARKIVLQVMRALAVAHEAGIVHRDIKPGNILIDRHGTAKVADFGIAMVSGEAGRERYTGPAAAMGTYDYMAPEQRVDAASSDSRADIYSTATMLYEMLTGCIPVGAFQLPSKARPGVHPGWDAVVGRGMHPLRDQRHPTMAAFLDAVESLSFAVPAAAGPAPGHPGILPREVWKCPECRQIVRDDAQFCPSCRAAQFMECSGCGARMRTAVAGCEQCGADLQKQRSYDRFRGVGLTALERARTAETPTERIQAAVEAGVALVRARKLAADEAEVTRLLDEANHIVESLATQLAEQAVSDGRHREAVEMLDAVLDVAPGRTDAAMLRQKLVDERERGIADAISRRDSGRPNDAVRLLAELAKRFANDQQIDELLQDCQRRFQGIAAVVRETVPGLVAARKWWAVQAVVRQLQEEGAQVQGLCELADRAKRTLDRVDDAITLAEGAIEREEYTSAILHADRALIRVADHPRAIELRAIAIEARDKAEELLDHMKCALHDGRAFKAKHLAKNLSPVLRSQPVVNAVVAAADLGLERANRFAAVVIAGLVGGAVALGCSLWLPMPDPSGVLQQSRDLLGPKWPVTIVAVWGGIATIVGISHLLQRPIALKTVGMAGACGLTSVALAGFFLCMAYGFDLIKQEGNGQPLKKSTSERLQKFQGACKTLARPWVGKQSEKDAEGRDENKKAKETACLQVCNAILCLGCCVAAAMCLSAIAGKNCSWGVVVVAVSAGVLFAATLENFKDFRDRFLLLAPCLAWISVTGLHILMWSRRDAIQCRLHIVDRLASGQWGLGRPVQSAPNTRGSRRS